MHPGLEELIQYSDGRGEAGWRRKLERHFATCEACRVEVERLRMAIEPGGHLEVPPVESLLTDIQRWAERRRREDPRSQNAISRVAEVIGPYLGERGSRKILNSVSEDGEDLLSTIEPVLGSFLGRRATKRLMHHIVDHAIMRT